MTTSCHILKAPQQFYHESLMKDTVLNTFFELQQVFYVATLSIRTSCKKVTLWRSLSPKSNLCHLLYLISTFYFYIFRISLLIGYCLLAGFITQSNMFCVCWGYTVTVRGKNNMVSETHFPVQFSIDEEHMLAFYQST